jgi:hypothetical protein
MTGLCVPDSVIAPTPIDQEETAMPTPEERTADKAQRTAEREQRVAERKLENERRKAAREPELPEDPDADQTLPGDLPPKT